MFCIDGTRPVFLTAIVICVVLAGGCSQTDVQQSAKPVAAETSRKTTDSEKGMDHGMDRLIDTMSRLGEKRDAHTLEVRSLKDGAERQSRGGEFPPIEKELDELVALESEFRGKPIGCLAVVHLCLLASSYSGTERPVHQALDTVLVHLEKYGHLKDLAIAFERLVAHDGINTGDALTRLIDAKATLPFVRESARLCKARWQLEMVANRDMSASGLEELTDPAEINRVQEYLKKNYPSETDSEQWKIAAISELDALAADATENHVSVFKAVDPQGIVLTEDSERTAQGPTIAALAKGLSFRAKHLTPGGDAPNLEVKLVTGDRWVLRDQARKLVIVQFSFKGCGPCERMYPVLRDIVRDYPDKVSVLSVMADANVETTQEAVEAGKMTWNVTWDGASGPIATEWGIRNFPSVFLFDADNKLLASDLPAEYLEEGVKALLNQQSN